MIGVIGVMVRRNIIIIFMSIELILNAVNINLVAFSNAAAERGRPGVRDLRDCGGGGRSRGRARHHPGVLPEQGNRQHRRDEPDALVGQQVPAGRPSRATAGSRPAGPVRSDMEYIWLIPLLPGHRRRDQRPRRDPFVLAADGRARGVRDDGARRSALSLVAFWQLLGLPAGRARLRRRRRRRGFRRFRSQTARRRSARFQVPWGFRLDPLSGMMLLVVTGIGTLIHVYSTAYMADEPRGGVRAVLLLPEPVLLLHAHARPGKQLPGDVRGLGGRRASARTC